MSETTIGIVGQGFVGSAIREGLNNYYKVLTYDIDSSKCNSTHEEVCKESNIIFVCIPTPMKKSGECDTRLLENVVDGITKECAVNSNANKPILVLKSTIPPGTTKRINKNTNLQVCFSPEFLTEANSFEDFKNQNRIIVGGDPAINCDDAKKIKTMFRKPFPNIPIVVTKSETAEMVKYFVNCFLATKVSFSNELYQICEESGLDFNKVVEYALYDSPWPFNDRSFVISTSGKYNIKEESIYISIHSVEHPKMPHNKKHVRGHTYLGNVYLKRLANNKTFFEITLL